MDPHGLYPSVCALMVCLLGATRLSSGDKCKCPEIPPKDLTVREGGCFNSTYRYRCIPGYTRKSGSINFIKCQETNGVFQWTESTLECIIDPNYKPPPATTTHPEFRTHPMISREAPPGPSSTSKPSAPPKKEQSILERTTIRISLIGVVLLIVCGVFFFLYRQRNKLKPPRDPQEREAELLTMM